MTSIQLIVGLGNPGSDYALTRHNAGAWLVEMLAQDKGVELKPDSKFFGQVARIVFNEHSYWLLIPGTYMNRSGRSVKAMADFYKIPPSAILVMHDELDFPPGTVRLKQNGGHGGHNGLRDIAENLHSKDFHRLRIGIGHPGHRDEVTDYVLSRPSKQDRELILNALHTTQIILPSFLAGNFQAAMAQLHGESYK